MKRYHKKTGRGSPPRPERRFQPEEAIKVRVERGLAPVLETIGAPESGEFIPDPFQLDALELVKEHDVLVCAPTGSGKTWIASQAIDHFINSGKRIWYASPLKALSNSIYSQFCLTFGSDACGILTGDRKENTQARIIVGTTEILRNQLYDAMHRGEDIETDMVVLDEAHYLSDPDRGVVWEEVLIYLPPRVRLLMLSATISNPGDLRGWLKEIRDRELEIVSSSERPVPLKMLFLFPDGLVTSLGGRKGINRSVKKFSEQRHRNAGKTIRYEDILACLKQLRLLPAIFFLKSRADCDRALKLCPELPPSSPLRKKIKEAAGTFFTQYPHLKGNRQAPYLLERAVGAHHAGQLPYWKALIEEMMGKGLLNAIFSTSTVAAGVNFPARTVVLMQSDRFNGREFVNLTSTDLHQMIGRAGRRGKDKIGFALIVPGRHQDPFLLQELESSVSEPLVSRIHINFSMTLNLLLSHTPDQVKDMLERSFAAYQERQKARGSRAKTGPQQMLWMSFKKHLRFLKRTGFAEKDDTLTGDGLWASRLRIDQPLLIAEAIRKEAFDGLTPAMMAAALAPFVWDRPVDISVTDWKAFDLSAPLELWARITDSIGDIMNLKTAAGLESPPLQFWPAAAVYLWAGGTGWETLSRFISVDEGDLASLVMRTADHLRQIKNLSDTHPALARTAGEAIALIMREPVYIE